MANVEELSDKAITLIRCPVCLEDFCQDLPPITLQCGHNLCRDCINRLKKRQAFLKCPIDNQNKKVISQSVNLDFLELIENVSTNLDKPHKRPRTEDRELQCEYSDIMQSWQTQYRRTSRRVQQLEEQLQSTYERFKRLSVYCMMQQGLQAPQLQ